MVCSCWMHRVECTCKHDRLLYNVVSLWDEFTQFDHFFKSACVVCFHSLVPSHIATFWNHIELYFFFISSVLFIFFTHVSLCTSRHVKKISITFYQAFVNFTYIVFKLKIQVRKCGQNSITSVTVPQHTKWNLAIVFSSF